MKTVWKYELVLRNDNVLDLPAHAELLSVGFQAESLVLWVLVDPSEPEEIRRFRVAGTGHVLPDRKLSYVGTAVKETGGFSMPYLALHVFEVER